MRVWETIERASLAFAVTLALATAAGARPYYAAKKGLSCAACHIAPSGGGARRPSRDARVRINDTIHLGADFRVLASKSGGPRATPAGAPANVSGFDANELVAYLAAMPSENLSLVYANNNGTTAEGYAMWTTDRWPVPVYARAGRFWLPYGLQTESPTPFSPGAPYTRAAALDGGFSPPAVDFSMEASAADKGVEVGLNPKKGYFLNLAVTNGATGGGGKAGNESKAWTARAGFVAGPLALGVTGFRNHSLAPAGFREERAGVFGWARWRRLAAFGEYGLGVDRPNAGGPRAQKRAGLAELDLDLIEELLLLKARYEFVNRDTVSSANARRRYSLGLEWLSGENYSAEAQYRILTEPPEVKNNQGLLSAHVWF